MILFSSCSEYINQIELTYDEVLFVKKIIDKLNINEADHILEHFGYTDLPNMGFIYQYNGNDNSINGGFIEKEIVNDYEFLRDLILALRKHDKTKDEILDEIDYG